MGFVYFAKNIYMKKIFCREKKNLQKNNVIKMVLFILQKIFKKICI